MSVAPSADARLDRLRQMGVQDDRMVAEAVRLHLADVREYLAELHEKSSSGRVVNQANSDLTDRLLRRLFALAEERILADGGDLEMGVCVVAVGGYARREMSIYSDVDLLILYRDELTPYVATVAERLQYWLWDAGVKLGCATRTIEDTVAMGREDVTVCTAVLTVRFLCGDGEFFHVFSDTIRRELLQDTKGFIEEQVELLHQRHLDYGESLFLLQPNVKEGAGTLRDYHTAYWVARGAQPALRDIDDLLHFGLLTESEMEEFRTALDFIWRVRNELHLVSQRANDQMSFELQEQVAEGLGYGSMADYAPLERESGAPEESLVELRFEPDNPDLPVERFMRDYYLHARVIKSCSELVIAQCASRASEGGEEGGGSVEVEEGFCLCEGELEIPHSAHLRERPLRMLLAFSVAQTHDVPLSRMAQRFIRENLPLIGDEQRSDPSFIACFMRILDARNRVTRSLTVMNDTGLLAAFVPEWEHIVCRWQHVVYHTYTVDVHSIFLVEELRRLWRGKYREAMPELSELMQEVQDRTVLFLGCLLHDIGKGFGGHHSSKGTVRAQKTLVRLGLSQERSERVLFIVQHHLLMSHLAQSRDLSDPKLILELAQLCGDRKNLRNLYLSTFADIRASSRDAWTEWKGQLLRELFERSAEMLETGADDPDKAMELIEARVEVRRQGAREELNEQGVDPEKVQAFFDGMPRRYFITHTPRQIARHAQVVLAHGGGVLLNTAFREMRGGFTEFILCTSDRHGLYSQVAGTMTGLGFNILGSHVYTSRSGIALEVYRLSTPTGGDEERELAWRELDEALQRVLAGDIDVADMVRRRRKAPGQPKPPFQKPVRVIISNSESDFYTLVDVIADDRIGLLYDITRCLGENGLEIYISKAATIKDQVTDTFYLKGPSGRKLRDPERLEQLRKALLDAAAPPDDEGSEAGLP
ncbi:MAG: HD domain-containing protein [Deltaproteobacteria bacterium]|nr:HD domain-containing protein [Deltaproteobacteria bacterium]